MTSRRGRRPGASTTREAILSAAQHLFAELGYDRTSLRAVAREAGVDQKLVSYFFGSKQQLFMAAVAPKLPPNVKQLLPQVLSGSAGTLGTRIAGLMVKMLEDPEIRDQLVGAVKAAASEPEAALMLRDMRAGVLDEFAPAVAEAIGDDDITLRVAMINAQFLGMVMAREVVGVPAGGMTRARRMSTSRATYVERVPRVALGQLQRAWVHFHTGITPVSAVRLRVFGAAA